MILPDFILVNALNLGLTALRNDYLTHVSAGTEERSVLRLMFADAEQLGNYDVFTQAKKMLINTKEDGTKHLEVRSALDQNFNGSPFLYVTLAAESDRNNSVNQGIGDNDTTVVLESDGTSSEKRWFQRRFAATYQLVIGSENKAEVVVLYNVFQALLMVLTSHITFGGLLNLKFGGQDLRVDLGVPDKIVVRAITISFEYEQKVPEFAFTTIATRILLYWQAQGSQVALGPIVITEESDDQSN